MAERGDRLERLGRQHVGRVRTESDREPTVAAVVGVEERLCLSEEASPRTALFWELENPRGHDAADARLQRGFRHHLVMGVLLAGGRDPAHQQLVAAEQHPPANVVTGEPALARPDDLFEPTKQREAVTRPPQQGHGGVCVRVDESRHHEAAKGDVLAGKGRGVRSRPDPGNPVPDHVEDSRTVHRCVAVDGDDGVGAVADRSPGCGGRLRDHPVTLPWPVAPGLGRGTPDSLVGWVRTCVSRVRA